MIALGFLYLVFRAKRRQRIISVLEANTNTSLEFLSTIPVLHFIKQDHKHLARQMTRLFLSFVRNRYGITLRSLEEKGQLNQLAQVSGIPMAHITRLALVGQNIEQSSLVSENTLVAYHQLIDHFYKNCS